MAPYVERELLGKKRLRAPGAASASYENLLALDGDGGRDAGASTPTKADDAEAGKVDDDALATLPRVLLLHCGGTLGMGVESCEARDVGVVASPSRPGYRPLAASKYLLDVLKCIPELAAFARVRCEVLFNKDSTEMTPDDWIMIARRLHARRESYDAFIIAHGTDTMAYTASALSLMLGAGFGKPVVLTGSQLPLAMARSDARQNVIDALTCCVASVTCGGAIDFREVAVCFGGKLLRGNRVRKQSATIYAAFESPGFAPLAKLGVGVEWNERNLLKTEGVEYEPKFTMNTNVIRVPIVPGVNARQAYGDLYGRGVRGIILEAFGVGNFPAAWLEFLTEQAERGLRIYLSTQCESGDLHPELYASGQGALDLGAKSGPLMTPECAVVKMMLALEHESVDLNKTVVGEA
jgi:L-asparaginase